MYELIKVETLDHFGLGIAHINNKVVFIKNALPNEVVDIEITKEKKNFSEAKVIRYHKKSKDRIESLCPYFGKCGGCDLQFLEYQKTLDFKKQKANELLKKNGIKYDGEIQIIENSHPFYYRNKISLKIKDGKIGYYKENTHDIVAIKECVIARRAINKMIEKIDLLHITNGELTIRCNTNDEILLNIESNENNNIKIDALKKEIKLVGIVFNNKIIYGDSFFYERIGGYLFKVSYNSFFQVNHDICEKLFNLLNDNIEDNSIVLDLFSGVGTLSIVASAKAKEVYSVEIIENAVLNGIENAKLNHKNNIKMMLGDVSKVITKLKQEVDTLIVDPPRKGLDDNTINFILENKIKKVIYISCDINTLMRDLKKLQEYYNIKDYKLLDMFSYSYHVENFVVLERRI